MQLFSSVLMLTISTLAALAYSQYIDQNDIPLPCRGTCSSTESLTTYCDLQYEDTSAYIDCVCSGDRGDAPRATNVESNMASCEACVAYYSPDGDHNNNVNELVRSCSFSTTTWPPASTDATSSPVMVSSAATGSPATAVLPNSTPSSAVSSPSSLSSSRTPAFAISSGTAFPPSPATVTDGSVTRFSGTASSIASDLGSVSASVSSAISDDASSAATSVSMSAQTSVSDGVAAADVRVSDAGGLSVFLLGLAALM